MPSWIRCEWLSGGRGISYVPSCLCSIGCTWFSDMTAVSVLRVTMIGGMEILSDRGDFPYKLVIRQVSCMVYARPCNTYVYFDFVEVEGTLWLRMCMSLFKFDRPNGSS